MPECLAFTTKLSAINTLTYLPTVVVACVAPSTEYITKRQLIQMTWDGVSTNSR